MSLSQRPGLKPTVLIPLRLYIVLQDPLLMALPGYMPFFLLTRCISSIRYLDLAFFLQVATGTGFLT